MPKGTGVGFRNQQWTENWTKNGQKKKSGQCDGVWEVPAREDTACVSSAAANWQCYSREGISSPPSSVSHV